MANTSPTTDLDIPALESVLAHRIIGRRIHHYDLIGSTMDEARRLASDGAADGTVVIAEEQTAGRGRFNRAWVSPRGENLSFSVILTPPASRLPYMNMAATLFRLTPEETLAGVTRNAARALGLSGELGTLEAGKQCDLAVWDIAQPAELAYRMGFNPLHQRIVAGERRMSSDRHEVTD